MDYLVMLLWILIAWACIHVLFLARKRASCNSKLPPGPIPLPIVGNLFKLGDKPNESLTELAKTYGPLMTLRLGCKTTIIVSSANMAKEILQKNDQACTARNAVDALHALNFNDSSIVWSQPTERWRKLRKISTTQMFSAARLEASKDLRIKIVQDLLAQLHEHRRTEQPVVIREVIFVTIVNLLSNTIFSVNLVDPNSKSAQDFKDIVTGVMKESGRLNLVDYFPMLRAIDPQGIRRRMMDHLGKLFEVFDRMIDERMLSRSMSSDHPRRNDFLDVLLDETEQNGLEIGRDDIKGVLGDMFIAGTDPSAATIEWALAELLRNPDSMAKARAELRETIGSRQVKDSDIASLPYIKAVVKETLRLHPPAPFFFRDTIADVEIDRFTIPKNTTVKINVWSIGRDPKMWANPSDFWPERFLESDIDFKGQDFELIPFGSGRRICPGLPLAFRTLHVMLASLLHSFSWKLPDGMTPKDIDMSDKVSMTLELANPLRVVPMLDG
ncbi:geraniol 8-hydroxylase-like [Magnolia sinica]|uniref:geraniol 8-hydroxylase-like n=1 Tax=Magnolia sinica TaxID=86752 RepID=UPI00265A6188|nr:geraniol 8-hydroxylase-like [Magnolia sinica]